LQVREPSVEVLEENGLIPIRTNAPPEFESVLRPFEPQAVEAENRKDHPLINAKSWHALTLPIDDESSHIYDETADDGSNSSYARSPVGYDNVDQFRAKRRASEVSTASAYSASSRASTSSKRQRGNVIQDMENRISELKEQNAELRSHLTDVTERAVEMERQRLEMVQDMTNKLQTMSPSCSFEEREEIQKMLDVYVDNFADYGLQRKKEVE
jgi:hypothetical protein